MSKSHRPSSSTHRIKRRLIMETVTGQPYHFFLIAALALVGTGCQGWFQPKPDRKQLEAVNEMVGDRTQSVLDVMKLLQTDPSTPVGGPTGTLTSDEAVQWALE